MIDFDPYNKIAIIATFEEGYEEVVTVTLILYPVLILRLR